MLIKRIKPSLILILFYRLMIGLAVSHRECPTEPDYNSFAFAGDDQATYAGSYVILNPSRSTIKEEIEINN